MAGQIAILEGWKEPYMPRKRKRGGGHAKFTKAAKKCSRIVKRRGGSFRACMRRLLKKGGRRRR